MTTPSTTKKNGDSAHPAPDQPTVRDFYRGCVIIGALASGDVKAIPDMQEAGAMETFVSEVDALTDVVMAGRNRP